MDNPADTFKDNPPPANLANKQGISWLRFILQVVSVVAIYLVGSTLPILPMVFVQGLNGETIEIGSAAAAVTAIVGMALALGTCWLWLRKEKRLGEVFNLSAPESWRNVLGMALLATGGTIAIFALGGALVQALGLPQPDPSYVLDMVTESPAMFVLWVVGVAWFAAGFGEELLWRGFLMDRLERIGGLRGRVWLVLVIQAILFGLPHLYQGWGGVIVTGMVGLLLGWVRIMQRGNLWAVVIAHAAVDTIMMSLAYADKLGLAAA